MLKKLFGKKEEAPKTIHAVAPLTGSVKSLEEVPDPVFSQKMMGDGVAIDPTEGKVLSPLDGEIMQLFPTKHAVGIKGENGAEILIHIGLETVSMNGEGFESHVSEGSKVKKGDTLITYDLELVNKKAKSTITPIILTNGDDMGDLIKKEITSVTAGKEEILEIHSK